MKYTEFKKIAIASFKVARVTWFGMTWEEREATYHAMDEDEDIDMDSEEFQFFEGLYIKERDARREVEEEGYCADCGHIVQEDNEGDAAHPVYVSHCKCS